MAAHARASAAPRHARRPIRAGAVVASLVGAVAACTLPCMAAVSFAVTGGNVVVGSTHYEIALSETDGSIVRVVDKRTGLGLGSAVSKLWSADVGGARVTNSAYSGDGAFAYGWNQAASELTLTYRGNAPKRPDVTVKVLFSDEPWLRLTAHVHNNLTTATAASPARRAVTGFGLPELQVDAAAVTQGLLPLMPGAIMGRSFFTDRQTTKDIYPGACFADYVALSSSRGEVAVYGGKSAVTQPATLGFEHLGAKATSTEITHEYRTFVAPGADWQAPPVFVAVGLPYAQSIEAYRNARGIAAFSAIGQKLGAKAHAYYESPLYKLDMGQEGLGFAKAETELVAKLAVPGIIHLVAYHAPGFDKGYPDFFPPDKRWGSPADFAAFCAAAHKQGNLVVPYTNFSWWDPTGHTLTNLPNGVSVNDVAVQGADGQPVVETYGPNRGLAMDEASPFVRAKVREQLAALASVGADGVLCDQWGARSAVIETNASARAPSLDPATAYFEGVKGLVRENAASALMTECGVDALADSLVGFDGTNLLWDKLGYRPDTAAYTSYYPMAGMLLRDKVLLSQHDLGPETFTSSRDMLTWNMAMGYNLSADIGSGVSSPWLDVVGVFQKYLLSAYADRRVLAYGELPTATLTRGARAASTFTDFGSFEVVANWDTDSPLATHGCIVGPGGAGAWAKDGSVAGGVFTGYNGSPLAKGEHYIVETRAAGAIRLFHPMGPDTDIRIALPSGWKAINVTARTIHGTALGKVKTTNAQGYAAFRCSATLAKGAVGYWEITRTK